MLLSGLAASHVIRNIAEHSRPEVISRNPGSGLGYAKVPGGWFIMVLPENGCTYGCGNIWFPMVLPGVDGRVGHLPEVPLELPISDTIIRVCSWISLH